MKKIWIHKADSFKEAEQFDREYYAAMTPAQRLAVVQFLRESHHKFGGRKHGRNRKGLRRSFKIVEHS